MHIAEDKHIKVTFYDEKPWFSTFNEPAAKIVECAPITEADEPIIKLLTATENQEEKVKEEVQETNVISRLSSDKSMVLIDSGSCINTVGDKELLHDYVSPSTSKLTFHSATNEGVRPAGEGNLYLPLCESVGPPVKAPTQHIPQIKSSILSPGWMLSALQYDEYSLVCNRNTGISKLTFNKNGERPIAFQGQYENYLAFIDTSTQSIGAILDHPIIKPKMDAQLKQNREEAIAQVSEICNPLCLLTAEELYTQVHNCIMSVTSEAMALELLTSVPGVHVQEPILHVSNVVERVLWHNRTGHPSYERLKKAAKMSTGMGNIKVPEDIEKCRTCMISKMRKLARGGPEDIQPTEPGQILAMDFGFMYQKSKNKARADRLVGIYGSTGYLLTFDLYTDLILGCDHHWKEDPNRMDKLCLHLH